MTVTTYPYPHVGHGTSRSKDAVRIWVWLEAQPTAPLAAELEAAIPATLLDVARSDGAVAWSGPLLYVDSGLDFRYLVKQYDPSHLAWLHEKLANGGVPDAEDLERVVRETHDRDLDGPSEPKRTVWDAFDADVEVWLARVASRSKIRLVVKDVDPGKSPSAWHRWSVEHLVSSLEALAADAATLPRGDGLDFAAIVVSACIAHTPPKKLSASAREACIALLDRGGLLAGSKPLATVVASYPAKERAALAARLLREHHSAVMTLFTQAATKKLLLDDGVYRVALEEAARCTVPYWLWINSRPGIAQLLDKPSEENVEHARRLIALIDANGELAARARAEAETGSQDHTNRSTLRDLEALRQRAG